MAKAAALGLRVPEDLEKLAIDRTNQELSPKGLYITRLFQEDQVFLRGFTRTGPRDGLASRRTCGALGVGR